MSQGLQVSTPERVSVELPIAGIGFRALAYLIDVGVMFTVGLIAYFVFSLLADPLAVWLSLSTFVRVMAVGSGFAALFTYWTAMEVAWHGQTLGKRAMRIRVVRLDGSPVTLFESALRNLMRVIDFLPTCYPVGVICMLVDARHRRLGDLVAGTVLVRDQAFDLSKYDGGGEGAGGRSTLSAQETELLTSFIERFESLEPGARLRLGRAMAAKFGVQAQALDEAAVLATLQNIVRA